MLKAAVDSANNESVRLNVGKPLLLGVTVLTSFDKNNLGEIGIKSGIEDQVLRLTELAVKSGMDGCVCSAHELAEIRKRFGNGIKLVVPGIRTEGGIFGDQKRVMTPKEAMNSGADYIVVGRPISSAGSPKRAVEEILREIGI